MSYEGVRAATVDDQGQLLLQTPGGHTLLVQAPVLYQQSAVDGSRQVIPSGYVVHDDGTVGFHLDAAYDPTRKLVLDPTLVLSSYAGGNGNDTGSAIATDTSGNIYLVGSTTGNFPTLNAYDSTSSGLGDAFLMKVSSTGVLLYSTHPGGVNLLADSGLAVAVDGAGEAFVSGQAGSSDFPTTSGAYQTSLSGPSDAFITKFSTAGNALVYSSFLGGSG